jgi:lysyl-tRNA synthetase class II
MKPTKLYQMLLTGTAYLQNLLDYQNRRRAIWKRFLILLLIRDLQKMKHIIDLKTLKIKDKLSGATAAYFETENLILAFAEKEITSNGDKK